jgi:HlyD family secretion protein
MALVSPSFSGSNVTPATATYVIIDPSTTYFSADLSETDLPKVKVGQKVKISLDAYPDENFEGTLENIGVLAFTSSTGGNAYNIRVTLPENVDLKFRVGMEGDGDIVLSTLNNVLKVPFNSVLNEDGKDYVWVYDNGKIKKSDVVIGTSSLDEVEIKSGISEGQKIVIDPSNKLIDNQKVGI